MQPSDRLTVRVTPRAKRAGIHGVRADGVLLLRVGAPPEDGRATEEACAVVARALRLRARQVSIVSGATSRTKLLAVDAPDAAERIAALLQSAAGAS